MMSSSRESFRSSEARIVAPYPLTRTIRVKRADEGKSVLGFFMERFPYLPEERWMERLRNGWICSGGEALKADEPVTSQQLIHHFTPKVKEPSVSAGVEILRDEEEWLLVNKPAPLPMHQGGRYYKNTLIYILAEMGYSGLKIVHRLDAVTSGLVILAKNKAFAARLRKEFEEGRVEKWYHAIVAGEPEQKFTVDAPIRRKRGFVFECGENLEGAKSAVTRIEPVESRDGVTMVRCLPVTGRTHQIRLHLQHAGYPIIDDPIYGPDGDSSGRRLQNCAISLQSFMLKAENIGISESLNRLTVFDINH